MLTTRLTRRLWPPALAALVAAIALTLSLPSTSPGIIVNDKPAALAIVDLAGGQTLRISVSNVVGFDPQPDPPICRLLIGFVDAGGSAIGNPIVRAASASSIGGPSTASSSSAACL